MELTKVMKFEIYSENKEIYKLLHELMFETRKIQNKTIMAMYEWSDFKFAYKEKHGVYPRPDEILEKKNKKQFYGTIQGYIDYFAREIFYKNMSGNSSNAIQSAVKLFNDKEKEMQKCICTLPYYRTSNRIFLKKCNFKLYKHDNKYYIDIGLLSTKYKNELELDSGRVIFNMKIGDNTQRTIIKRVLDGEYSIAESQLIYNKRLKKFFIYLSYSFNQKVFAKCDNILGIDLGIKYPLYIALKDSLKRWKINGGEIEAFRKQVEKRRYLMRKQRLVASNRSKGRNKMLKPVTDIGDKVARFRDAINHRYSKFVIDIARKNNVDEIVMEKLEGISNNNLFLKDWSYYDLQQKIKYKAEMVGIKVTFINPAYTSQTCSHCGHVAKENRPEQEIFKCQSCEFEENADYNAAVNIANKTVV